MVETKLTPHQLRTVAVRAEVDPRTVQSFIRGARQSEAVRRALRDAFDGLGIQVPRPGDVETVRPAAGKAGA